MKFDHIKLNEIFFFNGCLVLSHVCEALSRCEAQIECEALSDCLVLSCLLSHVKCEHL